jgi:carotenoid cleavage dioxygenase
MADAASLRQFLTRLTLDWSKPDAIDVERLSDVVCEYPRIDERRTGLRHRYAFVACEGGPGTGDLFQRALGTHDLERGTFESHHFGRGCAVSEPMFVPRSPSAAAEGDGYLLATVFDEERGASHLAILDPLRIEDGPVARVHLAHRVPLGFHGTWR